jgi:hypothetical protein
LVVLGVDSLELLLSTLVLCLELGVADHHSLQLLSINFALFGREVSLFSQDFIILLKINFQVELLLRQGLFSLDLLLHLRRIFILELQFQTKLGDLFALFFFLHFSHVRVSHVFPLGLVCQLNVFLIDDALLFEDFVDLLHQGLLFICEFLNTLHGNTDIDRGRTILRVELVLPS